MADENEKELTFPLNSTPDEKVEILLKNRKSLLKKITTLQNEVQDRRLRVEGLYQERTQLKEKLEAEVKRRKEEVENLKDLILGMVKIDRESQNKSQ